MISTLLSALLTVIPQPVYDTIELPEETNEPAYTYMVWGDEYFTEIYEQDKCVEWTGTALSVGWPIEEIPKLLRIMYRESRCIPIACGETDSPHLRKCRDWGLMQINDHSWKRIIREQGYHIEDMWNPTKNLEFALWLFRYSEERNGDGWQPWKKVPQ
jgi:hypothetical protein